MLSPSPDRQPVAARATNKINNFNLLRVLLATTVIFFHSFLMLGFKQPDPVWALLRYQTGKWTKGDLALTSGALAVYGFFILSGYLVTMSFQRSRGLGDYFKKRALRIYPGFLAVVLLCALVFAPLGASDQAAYWASLRQHAGVAILQALNLTDAGLQAPYSHTFGGNPMVHTVDASLWSIRYEFLCYLLVAALGTAAALTRDRLPGRVRRLLPLGFFAAAYGLYVLTTAGHCLGWDTVIYHFGPLLWLTGKPEVLPRLIAYFAAGMCLYLYRDRIAYTRPHLLLALAILAVSVCTPPLLVLTLPLFGPYVLLYAAFSPRLQVFPHFGTRNDLTYGVYLYSFPVQQLLMLHLGRHFNPYTLFLVTLPPTFLLAWLSWTLVERPCLLLKSKPRTVREPVPARAGLMAALLSLHR